MLNRIDRVILRVPSVASAVLYYRDVLGLKLLRQEQRLASFVMSDGLTELVVRDDSDQPAEETYYLVPNVRELFDRRAELKLKFVQSPQPVARGFKAAVKDPFGNVMLLIDRSAEAGMDAAEAAPGALFAGAEPQVSPRRQMLAELYVQVGRTADDLPYTPEFEKLYELYSSRHADPKPSRREVWRHLLNLRKGRKLPRLGDSRVETPAIAPEAAQALRGLLGEDIGRRDRLPYTPRFDELVDAFNQTQTRSLSPHLVWRLVAKLAK